MNCEIGQNIVGCRVVIETQNGTIEGDVRHVDPSRSKMSIVNGILVPSGIQLPSLYRVFVRDILSIHTSDGSSMNSEKSLSSSPGVCEELAQTLSQTSTSPHKSSEVSDQNKNQSSFKPKKSCIPALYTETTKSALQSDRKIKPLIVQKNLPLHLKLLNNHVKQEILTNKVPLTENGKEADSLPFLPNYTIIEEIDDLFTSAVHRIEQESVIGLSMEGVRVGRFGVVCWIGIGLSDHAFLFDMLNLGPAGVRLGLADILMSPKVVKVTHNCRFMSDAFLHQFRITLENVFDTQVGSSVVDMKRTGKFNRFVSSLPRCLSDFLNLPANSMFHPRIREGHEKEDESIWKQRPLPQHLIEGAVFNVCHLKKLRVAIMETILSEVIEGTKLYLKDVSQLEDDSVLEKGCSAHLIPVSFKTLAPTSFTQNGEEFQSVISSNGCDPYVSFTRHIPHARKK